MQSILPCDAHRPNETGDKYSADDCAFSETVNVLSSDRSKVWNSLAVEAIYTDNEGYIMSRRALVEKVLQHFGDEVLSLYSPGMATLMVFRKHVPTNLKLVDDDENDFMDECVRKVGKQIMKEAKEMKRDFNSYSKHINIEIASESASGTLSKLLSVITPKFNSLQSIMVGNIVCSLVTC